MMNIRDRGDLQLLVTTAAMTERLCALPAVATLDWCDRAAECVSRLFGEGAACVWLGTVEPGGKVRQVEATGASTTPNQKGIDPSELRSRIEQRASVGFAVDPRALSIGLCSLAADLTVGTHDNGRALSHVWKTVGPESIVVAIVPLGAESGGRVLLVEAANLRTRATDNDVAVLSALIPTLTQRALVALGSEPCDRGSWLTPREQLVLEKLTLGMSVREIADTLGRSPHTVHDHVKSLHRKLSATSRGALIARALGHGANLVEPKLPRSADRLAQVIGTVEL